MKPTNKFQKRVVEVSKKLPKLTTTQIKWAYENVIEHVGVRNKKGKITCTKCGHSWQGHGDLVSTLADHDCPNCKTELKILNTQKRTIKGCYYMTIITTCKEFQVLRTILVDCVSKVGELSQYTHSEVMQRWIAPNGKQCTFARLRQTMGTSYIDSWIFNRPLELRSENVNNKYCINVYDRIHVGEIYPRQKLIPELKRTGIKKDFLDQKPLQLFKILLADNRAETLLKAKQTNLLKRLMDMGWQRNIDNYWASIRICLRNNYKINDAIMWCDYIDNLRFAGKDLHNAKFVCPTDLHKEHNRYVAKKAKIKLEQEIQQHLDKEDAFKEVKGKFFGLTFSDGQIQIRVLESVAEIITEGKIMHHCVGGYYSKEDSLILSACIDGKQIETIEVSISQLKVIQSRGVCNTNTEYHDRIINLVNENISQIERRLVA